MGRVLGLTVAVVGLMAALAAPAGAATMAAHCTDCGYISAHGTGTIVETATSGQAFATVGSADIYVRGANVTVRGASSHHWSSSFGGTVYTGSGMSVTASGSFKLKIVGKTTNFGSTAHANVTLSGSGSYRVNNSSWKPWSAYRALAIRW